MNRVETSDLEELPDLGRQETSKRHTVWGRLDTSDETQRHVLDIFSRSPQFLTLSNDILVVAIPILATNPRPSASQIVEREKDPYLAEAVWRYAQIYRGL